MIDQYPPANGVLTSLIWRKTMSGGETSLSGYDNASQALSYTPGQEQVYLNGILLVRGSDYTATNGTSITGLTALAADDFVQINCYNNFSVASVPTTSLTGTIANNQLANSAITINGNAISLGGSVSLPGDIESVTAGTGLSGGGNSGAVTLTNTMATEITAKGDLIVGTGSGTFDNLPVAADGSILVADSSVSPTGLKWAVDPVADVVTTAGDLIYATAADTVTRLGIGTAGQVLQVNSGATAPEWATPAGGSSGPSFSAESNTAQSISASTNTKVTFQVENWDTDSAFASSRFTPQKAGYYQVNAIISYVNNASTTSRTLIYKNGAGYNPGGTSIGPAIANPTLLASCLVDLNGTTDYIELYGFNDAASGTREFYRAFFNAVWIRSL